MQREVSNLTNENKSLRGKLTAAIHQQWQNSIDADSVNDLQYQLDISVARQRDAVLQRDKLRTELRELESIKHEYATLANKYNLLHEYNAVVAKIYQIYSRMPVEKIEDFQ